MKENDARVVLHGIDGIGKSYLAVAAICDQALLRKYFEYTVFWIALGDKQDEEQNLKHMRE